MAEIKLNQIKHVSGITLKSKIRDGIRTYILSDSDIEKIITQLMEKIEVSTNRLLEKRKENQIVQEPKYKIKTGNKYGSGYGD